MERRERDTYSIYVFSFIRQSYSTNEFLCTTPRAYKPLLSNHSGKNNVLCSEYSFYMGAEYSLGCLSTFNFGGMITYVRPCDVNVSNNLPNSSPLPRRGVCPVPAKSGEITYARHLLARTRPSPPRSRQPWTTFLLTGAVL